MTQHLFDLADCNGDGRVRCELPMKFQMCSLTRVSLEEFRSFCAFFFLLQRRQAESRGGVGSMSSVTPPVLKLLFTAADTGVDAGAPCDSSSCDISGDGRLGREELKRLFLVLIRESDSLAWLQPKYRADPRFKHMLTDYCKSPLQWTAAAAMHEFLTFDCPPAIAAAPDCFTDATRLTWEGLSVILDVKRQSGVECTIEVLTRRWIDTANAQLAHLPSDHYECELWGGEVAAGVHTVAECDGFEGIAHEHASSVSASVPTSRVISVPHVSQPGAAVAGGHYFVGPGFPLPLSMSAPVAAGQAAGPTLRVDSAAAQRFVR
jgi:hypothetical protein